MTNRQLFLSHVGQTSPTPLAFEIESAKGTILTDVNGKKYIDLIGGISVCNIGHCEPIVIEAIKNQAEKYLHTMVYGEMVQSPQVKYATALVKHLPSTLNSVFFTTSGSEATEGALKLAKRYTGKTNIFYFKNSYHGSTQGSLSVMGSEYWQKAYRPLLPGTFCYIYNDYKIIEAIDENTCCVILEAIQAEAGVNEPNKDWLKALKNKCELMDCLLIIDAIQTGFGRTGVLWGFEHFDIVPDILLLGKALGGGMPLGAFVSDKKIMDSLSFNPILGHINTFGGHPVCCAAGLAAFEYLLDNKIIDTIQQKEQLFKERLSKIGCYSGKGLLIALGFDTYETNKKIIDECIENGLFTDWFLYSSSSLRIAPPLTITLEEINDACDIIIKSIKNISA